LRSIGLVVVLAALTLALVALLLAGSQRRLPAPFGLARTGLIAYSSNGDIYTADVGTGTSNPVVAGPETDVEPRWSLDGTHFGFVRRTAGEIGPGLIFVARADGSDAVQITPEPLTAIADFAFSPNGSEVLINAETSRVQGILFAAADGSGIRELDTGRRATQGAWHPPDGSEILFMDAGSPAGGFGGIRAVSPDGGEVRTILDAAPGRYRDLAEWSPDGSRIAYMEWTDSDQISSRIHVIAADGTDDRVLPMPPTAVWEIFRGWSNDGTRILALRGYTGTWAGSVAVVRRVDDPGFGLEIDDARIRDGNCCSIWKWAPDDSVILGIPTDDAGAFRDQLVVDPLTGTASTVPWSAASDPTWQRLAD
jgi:Tol biopolymer transport system component